MKKYNNSASFIATAVFGVSVAAALILHRRHRQRKDAEAASWLHRAGLARFAPGKAGVFTLDRVNRQNLGSIGGAGFLRCSDTGGDVAIGSLLEVPGLVLYSIELVDEEIFLLFVQVPSVRDVMFNLPFLDRGVRRVAEIGSKVYVAHVDAVESIPGLVPFNKLSPAEQSRVSFVWNTGRCGSTLLHRMLTKVGVLSFSEPYWLEAMCFLKTRWRKEEAIERTLGVCAAIDEMLARKSMRDFLPIPGDPSTVGRSHVSFNPKGKSFVFMDVVMRAMPHARHFFMYRDARKVVESFGSIMLNDRSRLRQLMAWLPWPGPPKGTGGGVARPDRPYFTFSKTIAAAMASGEVAEPTKIPVREMTTTWMACISFWREILESGDIPEGSTITLRMDEYVRQEPEMVKHILRFVLGGEVVVGEELVALALEAFRKHSQEGDRMAGSSFHPTSNAPRYLSAKDRMEIEAAVASVPSIGSPSHVLPGSLGYTPTAATS